MNKNRVSKICIITLIVCIIVIFIKNQYSHILLKDATYGIPALIDKGTVENLYIGSSMFRQGLDIHILNENTESDNYILAYNGNQPSSEYYQLKYLLEHGVKIQNLYIDMYVYSAWENPEISDEKIFMEIDIAEKWNLWQLIKKYSDSSLESFWRIFVNSNNELLLTWPIMSPILNSRFKDGGTLQETTPASYGTLKKINVVSLNGQMNMIQQEYLDKIIDAAYENNINLIFIETPKFETVSVDTSYVRGMKEYIKFLEDKEVDYILSSALAEQVEGSPLAIYEFDTSNAEYYMDTIHLSSYGRKSFSEKLVP